MFLFHECRACSETRLLVDFMCLLVTLTRVFIRDSFRALDLWIIAAFVNITAFDNLEVNKICVKFLKFVCLWVMINILNLLLGTCTCIWFYHTLSHLMSHSVSPRDALAGYLLMKSFKIPLNARQMPWVYFELHIRPAWGCLITNRNDQYFQDPATQHFIIGLFKYVG